MYLPGSYQNGFAPRDGEPLYPELWRGCVGAWNPGLGPTGTQLYDWSGYKNNGTLTSMAAASSQVIADGKHAISFSGSSERILTQRKFTPGLSAFSVSLWFKGNNTSAFGSAVTTRQSDFIPLAHKAISIGKGNQYTGAVGKQFGFILLDTTSRYRSVITTDDVDDGKNHHICAVSTGSSLFIYVDGQQKATTLTSAGSWPNIDDSGLVSFGAANDGMVSLEGAQYEIAIYNRILNPKEIHLLATHPGIAYEMAPRRRTSTQAAAAAFNAYWAARRSQFIGLGA